MYKNQSLNKKRLLVYIIYMPRSIILSFQIYYYEIAEAITK